MYSFLLIIQWLVIYMLLSLDSLYQDFQGELVIAEEKIILGNMEHETLNIVHSVLSFEHMK